MDQELLPLNSYDQYRFEFLLPWQLRHVIATSPIAYIPLGTFEWHCEHLPIGLDALTAHGLCLRAAAKSGGVVLPALHYGTGGGHGDYPFTIILTEPDEIEAQIAFTILKLKSFGFKKIVIFSGHFPDAQLDMIDRLAASHSDKDVEVFASAVNRIEGLEIAPDHAGVFETTLLYAMHPNLVQIDRLPELTNVPLTTDDWVETRHNPKHPVFGVFGPDPRGFEPSRAAILLAAAVDWLADRAACSRKTNANHK
jgi:creatinine amidohydrolase